jgi:hypothetical protein
MAFKSAGQRTQKSGTANGTSCVLAIFWQKISVCPDHPWQTDAQTTSIETP